MRRWVQEKVIYGEHIEMLAVSEEQDKSTLSFPALLGVTEIGPNRAVLRTNARYTSQSHPHKGRGRLIISRTTLTVTGKGVSVACEFSRISVLHQRYTKDTS